MIFLVHLVLVSYLFPQTNKHKARPDANQN